MEKQKAAANKSAKIVNQAKATVNPNAKPAAPAKKANPAKAAKKAAKAAAKAAAAKAAPAKAAPAKKALVHKRSAPISKAELSHQTAKEHKMMVHEKRKEIQHKCSRLHGDDIPAVHMCFEKEIEKHEDELFRGARFA